MNDKNNNIVVMKNITKSFGGLKALDNVDFEACCGEIHALMGENGAGKSTLIKILSGAYSKDAGSVFIDSKKMKVSNTKTAHENGVSVIYQEFALAPDLTVAENIFIDNLGDSKGIINWKQLRSAAKKQLEKLGFSDIDVSSQVSELTVAQQQIVEICKALKRDAKVLVLDEPTAVLTTNEVERLFGIIEELKAKGVCIVYISHRLEEIFRICDRITVLKDGKNVDTVNVSEVDNDSLVKLMIGRDMKDYFPKRDTQVGKEVFRVENLNCGNFVKDVSFFIRKGEVLGISGLVGAGRTETVRAIFGADKKDSGRVFLDGDEIFIRNPKDGVKHGIGMLPEDRKKFGVLLEMPIKINGTMSIINSLKKLFGWIDKGKEDKLVLDMMDKLKVKARSFNDNVDTLSGGNQQKVALMKWIASESKVLFLDEPTRGVDVGAKVEIYRAINLLAKQGVAIIMISSEMSEVIGMSDRALVMRRGMIVGELEKKEVNEFNLIKLAIGV